MEWKRALPRSRALVPFLHADELPRRRAGDRVRPRSLDPATERSLFAYLDENSSVFWAAYYAALATTSTAASDGSATTSATVAADAPDPFLADPRFGMPVSRSASGDVPLRRRRSLFERPGVAPGSPLPDCADCGEPTELSLLDLDSGGMKIVCTRCTAEVELGRADTPAAHSA